ncbi:MAG TPA: hypothetical protein VM099_12285 [Gemmatimonadaceae bacterium]|nr:hypothetical protein [Gemmatimonadaceae bacterium]
MTKGFVRTSTALAIAFTLTSCSVLTGPKEVTLNISNIKAPATTRVGESFSVTFTVQYGGCTRFDRLAISKDVTHLNVRAIGIDSSGPNTLCPANIVEEDHTVVVSDAAAGKFVVQGATYDANLLTREVLVQSQ